MSKNIQPIAKQKPTNFWAIFGLLAILLVCEMARDINRPFYGLHSWGEASTAWVSRAHVKYGLAYTKGVTTWAVGNPPPKNPSRYWDHPQLSNLILSVLMRGLGVSEQTVRIYIISFALLSLLVFLILVRQLTDDKTTLLSGLFFVLFPLVQYFGTDGSLIPLALAAYWFYLKLIGVISSNPEKRSLHYFGLAITTFLGLQFGWSAFFFAMAVGVHYVCHCIHRRSRPDKILLAILIFAPFISLAVDLTVMAAGYGWDIQKIVDLYKWRSAKGEMPEFVWGKWFAVFWEYAVSNFTIPVLIIVIAYFTVGQSIVFMEPKPEKQDSRRALQFPLFWLFLMPWVFQLFILRGCLWAHQTWESPMLPFISISCALGVLLIKDLLERANRLLANVCTTAIIAVIVIFCIGGANYYYGIRWQPTGKIEMFKTLNSVIPPDKALLSFEDFIVNQHASKGGFYRPEYAYYLDREIVPATSFEQIKQLAQTGRFPYYLIPSVPQLNPLINQLQKEYELFSYICGDPGETKNGKFYRAGMPPYMIFNLQNTKPINK
ncbi:MAG: hypothetical protein ABSG99_04270 [Sedimentisphaerales bacterium]